MKQFMKEVAMLGSELIEEERNLLSVAYKNIVGPPRASWRVLTSIEGKEQSSGEDFKVGIISKYREVVENELNDICAEILTLLTDHLIKPSLDTQSQVFYYKMAGDYYRYLSEFQQDTDLEVSKDAADKMYTKAMEIADAGVPDLIGTRPLEGAPPHNRDPMLPLEKTNPIRLGLALNCSVFYFEVMERSQKACDLAREAFDKAVAELEKADDRTYKDATLIMQLLRDNLTLWTDEEGAGRDYDEEGGFAP
jgi:14-3-3 protein epsilon